METPSKISFEEFLALPKIKPIFRLVIEHCRHRTTDEVATFITLVGIISYEGRLLQWQTFKVGDEPNIERLVSPCLKTQLENPDYNEVSLSNFGSTAEAHAEHLRALYDGWWPEFLTNDQMVIVQTRDKEHWVDKVDSPDLNQILDFIETQLVCRLVLKDQHQWASYLYLTFRAVREGREVLSGMDPAESLGSSVTA